MNILNILHKPSGILPRGRTCGPVSPTRENMWSNLPHQGEPVVRSPPQGRTCGPAFSTRENLWPSLPHQGEPVVQPLHPGRICGQPPPPLRTGIQPPTRGRPCGPVSPTRENLRSCLLYQGNLWPSLLHQEELVVLSSPPGRTCGPGSTSVRISQPSTNDRLLGYWFCRSNNEWTSKIRLDIRRFT